MIVWPQIPPVLVELLPTLPGWDEVKVFDGRPVMTSPPPVRCTVGYVEDESGSGGDFNQEVGDIDGLYEESGAVRCELVLTEGGSQVSALRLRAAALVDALDGALRADQTLGGVLDDDGAPTVTLGADWLLTQNATGASVRVALSVSYFARTT